MKKKSVLIRGLLTGIVVFALAEAILRSVLFSLSSFDKSGVLTRLGSFCGGLLIGFMGIIALACRPLSAITCVIFKVSPFICIPQFSKGFENVSMGISLFFWVSASMLFIYVVGRKNDEVGKRKRNIQLFVIIIFWLVGFFAIAKTAYYISTSAIEKKLSKVDISKLILGSWDDGVQPSFDTTCSRKYIETHYPNNTFKIEIVVTEQGKTTATIIHEGAYKIEGTIVKYTVERTTSSLGGWQFERRIINLTNNEFLYIDKNGDLVEARRID